ncbi:MAG TPA: hypothetical protein VK621_07450, partial [Bradyrhizobium sp.]|nr:hypothetical protein [Bradyrhizobium sp.]
GRGSLEANIKSIVHNDEPSLRANGSRECAPDDRLREAIQSRQQEWIASSLRSSQRHWQELLRV